MFYRKFNILFLTFFTFNNSQVIRDYDNVCKDLWTENMTQVKDGFLAKSTTDLSKCMPRINFSINTLHNVSIDGHFVGGDYGHVQSTYNITVTTDDSEFVYLLYNLTQGDESHEICIYFTNTNRSTTSQTLNFDCPPFGNAGPPYHIELDIYVQINSSYSHKKYWLTAPDVNTRSEAEETCYRTPFILAESVDGDKPLVRISTTCNTPRYELEYEVCCDTCEPLIRNVQPNGEHMELTWDQPCESNQFTSSRSETMNKVEGFQLMTLLSAKVIKNRMINIDIITYCNNCQYDELTQYCCGICRNEKMTGTKFRETHASCNLTESLFNLTMIVQQVRLDNTRDHMDFRHLTYTILATSFNDTGVAIIISNNETIKDYDTQFVYCCYDDCQQLASDSKHLRKICLPSTSSAAINIVMTVLVLLVILCSVAGIYYWKSCRTKRPIVLFLYCRCEQHKIYWTMVEKFIHFLTEECKIDLAGIEAISGDEQKPLMTSQYLSSSCYNYLCIVPLPTLTNHTDSSYEESSQRIITKRNLITTKLLIINLPFCRPGDLPNKLPANGRNIPSFKLMDDFNILIRYLHNHNPRWMSSNVVSDVWLDEMCEKRKLHHFTNDAFNVICDDRYRHVLQGDEVFFMNKLEELNDVTLDIDKLGL